MEREVHKHFGLTEPRNRDNANNFQTVKMVLLPVVYLNVMCCIIPHSEILATKRNATGNMKKKSSSCTLIKPFYYLGRGENVQVKKLNVTSHPCPHPLYRKNIQNIDRRQ